MVGTMWVWVIRRSSISRSVPDGDQPSMRTTPTPDSSGVASENDSGALW